MKNAIIRRQGRNMRITAESGIPLDEPIADTSMPDKEFLAACLEVLGDSDPLSAKTIQQELDAMKKDPQGKGMFYFIVEDAMEALNDIAPEGYFFGVTKNNRKDYGFWPLKESTSYAAGRNTKGAAMRRRAVDKPSWMHKWEVDDKGETSFYPKDDWSGKENDFEGYSTKKKAMILRARRRIRLKSAASANRRKAQVRHFDDPTREQRRNNVPIYLDNRRTDPGTVLIRAPLRLADAGESIYGVKWEYDETGQWSVALVEDRADMMTDLEYRGYDVHADNYWPEDEVM